MLHIIKKYPTQLEIAENFFFASNNNPCDFYLKNGTAIRATFNSAECSNGNSTIASIIKWELQTDEHSLPFLINHSDIVRIEQYVR